MTRRRLVQKPAMVVTMPSLLAVRRAAKRGVVLRRQLQSLAQQVGMQRRRWLALERRRIPGQVKAASNSRTARVGPSRLLPR